MFRNEELVGGVPPRATVAYWQVASRSDHGRIGSLQELSIGLVAAARCAAEHSVEVGAFGQAADAWISANVGPVDDELRRAALAITAASLPRRSRTSLPLELRHQQAFAHERLATALLSCDPLEEGGFTRDIAFVSGLAVPAGALTIFIPPARAPAPAAPQPRRAVGRLVRELRQIGHREAVSRLRSASIRPWAELHLDRRFLNDFHPPGLLKTYQHAGSLMKHRPDIAGLCGASWFFDPKLAIISPKLGFVRQLAEAGGARFLRLRTDPDQTAFALERSPTRRRIASAGEYIPCCFGMYWLRSDLIAWADRQTPLSDGVPELVA